MSRYFADCSFLFSRKAEYATRGGSSTFKNMPFLRQEGRLLRARRAYTRMQNVTHWFLVGYILDCREWHLRILRVANLVDCKDFLSSHELSSLTYITPNESWNALCSLYAEGPLWARNVRKKALLTLWALWEKNSPANLKRFFLTWRGAFSFSWGCVLFLTENHRWTEHTKAHRDIKSTDFTEPYSHLWQ